jgi:hypothetical protein
VLFAAETVDIDIDDEAATVTGTYLTRKGIRRLSDVVDKAADLKRNDRFGFKQGGPRF